MNKGWRPFWPYYTEPPDGIRSRLVPRHACTCVCQLLCQTQYLFRYFQLQFFYCITITVRPTNLPFIFDYRYCLFLKWLWFGDVFILSMYSTNNHIITHICIYVYRIDVYTYYYHCIILSTISTIYYSIYLSILKNSFLIKEFDKKSSQLYSEIHLNASTSPLIPPLPWGRCSQALSLPR